MSPELMDVKDAVNRDRIGQIFYYDCARYADFLNRYNPSDWGIVPENCYTISNTTERRCLKLHMLKLEDF